MAVADKVDYVHLDKLELLYMRRKDFGTKCSWDTWYLGQISGFWDIFGTKGIGTKCQWDN